MPKPTLAQARKVVLETLKTQGYKLGQLSREDINEMAKDYAKDTKGHRRGPTKATVTR